MAKKEKTIRPKWPKSWPLLEAGDIHKGEHVSPVGVEGGCCLYGHLNLFAHGNPSCFGGAAEKLEREYKAKVLATGRVREAIDECLGGTAEEKQSKCSAGYQIAHVNDEVLTKEQVARVWNRAGYLCGYTEGNPESKPLPKFAELLPTG